MNNLRTKIHIRLNDVADIKKFVNAARGFAADINVMNGRTLIDAKSIMGLFNLDLSTGGYVEIIADNPDEVDRFNNVMKEFEVC